MRRHAWRSWALVGLLAWVGCNVGSSSGEFAETDNGAAGATAGPSQDAPDGEQQQEVADLAAKRGFALSDLSSDAAYVLVKADAARVAEAIAESLGGEVTADAYGKSPAEDQGGTIVFRLQGHPWTVFALWPDDEFDRSMAELSKELQADVLTFAHSDLSGWSFVHLYRNGQEVESLHWGEDPSDLGLAAPTEADWDMTTKVTTDHGDEVSITDLWLFRSKLRKISEQDLQQGEAFNDALFMHYDAYLPDAEDMPWAGENGVESPLGEGAFDAVLIVTIDEQGEE